MTKEIYKSARGMPVDMGALRLKNEKERAVGNMKVNARGDAVDDKNQPIKSKHNKCMINTNNKLKQQLQVLNWI